MPLTAFFIPQTRCRQTRVEADLQNNDHSVLNFYQRKLLLSVKEQTPFAIDLATRKGYPPQRVSLKQLDIRSHIF